MPPVWIREIHGDQFAKGLSAQVFEDAGLRWKPARRNTSDGFLEFAAAMSSGKVRLLQRDDLLKQLRTLERRRGASRDRVDHRRGSHDDLAAACAGAILAALDKDGGPTIATVMPSGSAGWQERSFARNGLEGVRGSDTL